MEKFEGADHLVAEINFYEELIDEDDTYERIMTVYFPVSTEQLREKCGYDEDSGSYACEMIFERQYPPFGEVVDYKDNGDGTLTLIVDAVWPDYNSDPAFTNTIVVQPFEDGTFRYLSNFVEQKELEDVTFSLYHTCLRQRR